VTAPWYDKQVTIDLLCFGILKDFFGRERDRVELPDGASVGDLLEHLKVRQVAEVAVWSSVAIAVNREYAAASTILCDRDEVALLPPVSGGSDTHAR
jgi:molybdopterin converting factor small subunit